MKNEKSKTKIYRFNADGLAINPDSMEHEIEFTNGIKYSLKMSVFIAKTDEGWVGGGSLRSTGATYSTLTGINISCNDQNQKTEKQRKAILNVLVEIIKEAKKLKYPDGVVSAIGNLFDKHSQYKLFESNE